MGPCFNVVGMKQKIIVSFVMLLALHAPSVRAELRKDIEYSRPGGTPLLLDANIPDGPGPYPIAIVLHGGGWNSGDKAADAAPLLRALTDVGDFSWLSINYRLAPKDRWPACL